MKYIPSSCLTVTKNTKLAHLGKNLLIFGEILQSVGERKRNNHILTLGFFWLVSQGLHNSSGTELMMTIPPRSLLSNTHLRQTRVPGLFPEAVRGTSMCAGTLAPPYYPPYSGGTPLPLCPHSPRHCHGSLDSTAVLDWPATPTPLLEEMATLQVQPGSSLQLAILLTPFFMKPLRGSTLFSGRRPQSSARLLSLF